MHFFFRFCRFANNEKGGGGKNDVSNCSTFSTYTKTRTNAWRKIAKVRQKDDDCAAPKGSPLDVKTHQNIKRKKIQQRERLLQDLIEES